jgi:hypothetical protein
MSMIGNYLRLSDGELEQLKEDPSDIMESSTRTMERETIPRGVTSTSTSRGTRSSSCSRVILGTASRRSRTR